MAADPGAHKELLKVLIERKQNFSVGYLAPYTDWFNSLNAITQQQVQIHWNCRIDTGSWKSKTFADRGLFSYFGVHLIPLIYKLNPKKIDVEKVKNEDSLRIRLITESNCVELFLTAALIPNFVILDDVCGQQTRMFEFDTPFGKQGARGTPDPRIPLLKNYLSNDLDGAKVNISIAYEELFLELSSKLQRTQ